jgi:uncharacterized membrane protein YgaE (UPF0421/DUF939 family)
MATTTKRGSDKNKARLNRLKGKTSAAEQVQAIAELQKQLAESLDREKAAFKDLQDRDQQLAESLRRESGSAAENVRLAKELQDRNAELREALEHQTATSEVLGIISRSPTDVQPVLDAIVESAAKVCGVDDVLLRLRQSDVMIPRAHFGSIPMPQSR